MFWITSVPFCRTKELTGSEELPSLVQVILGLRSLSALHGRRRVDPKKGVTTWGGRILTRKGENIISWAATDTDPRIFCALHTYVPPSLFATLQIVKAPFTTEVLVQPLLESNYFVRCSLMPAFVLKLHFSGLEDKFKKPIKLFKHWSYLRVNTNQVPTRLSEAKRIVLTKYNNKERI